LRFEYSRSLSDGTLLSARHSLETDFLRVNCVFGGKEIASFTMNQRGLHRIKVNQVHTYLSGFDMDVDNIELGYSTNEKLIGLSTDRLNEFRNSAGAVVKWVSEMVKRNKFISPINHIVSTGL